MSSDIGSAETDRPGREARRPVVRYADPGSNRVALVGAGVSVAAILLGAVVLSEAPFWVSSVLSVLAIAGWLSRAFRRWGVEIDRDRNLLRRWRRWGLAFLRVSELPLDAIARIAAEPRRETWGKFVADLLDLRWLFAGYDNKYRLYAETLAGEEVPICGFPDAPSALDAAEELSAWLDVPVRDSVLRQGRIRPAEQSEPTYVARLRARPAEASSPGPLPDDPIGRYDYRPPELTVHVSPKGLGFADLAYLVGISTVIGFFSCAVLLLADNNGLILWLACGSFVAVLSFLVLGQRAIRGAYQESWLAVAPDGISWERRRFSKYWSADIPPETLLSVAVVKDVEPVEPAPACLWVGREGIVLTSTGHRLAFGMGLSRAELEWTRSAIDCILRDAPENSVAAVEGPREALLPSHASEQDPPHDLQPSPVFGYSGLRVSLKPDVKFIVTWAGLWVAAALVCWSLGAAVPEPEPPDPLQDPIVQEIREILEDPNFITGSRRLDKTEKPARE